MLHIIGVIGTAGGTGSVIEFCGSVIEKFSIEARMSMCNMSIEGGARAGLVAPDEITFDYVKGRPLGMLYMYSKFAHRYLSAINYCLQSANACFASS